MNPETIEVIIETAESMDLDVRTNYSGRGMFGARCLGVVGSHHELSELVQHVAIETGEVVPAPSTDSMGLDIIWYWPAARTDR